MNSILQYVKDYGCLKLPEEGEDFLHLPFTHDELQKYVTKLKADHHHRGFFAKNHYCLPFQVHCGEAPEKFIFKLPTQTYWHSDWFLKVEIYSLDVFLDECSDYVADWFKYISLNSPFGPQYDSLKSPKTSDHYQINLNLSPRAAKQLTNHLSDTIGDRFSELENTSERLKVLRLVLSQIQSQVKTHEETHVHK